METKATTKSAKINKIIEKAEKLGLLVEVETETKYETMETISVTIRRDTTGIGGNLLATVYEHEFTLVHAIRSTYGTSAKAFKISATNIGFLVKPRTIKNKVIQFHLEVMAEDLVRYHQIKAA